MAGFIVPVIEGIGEAITLARVEQGVEAVAKVGVAMEGVHEVYNDTTDTWHTIRESALGRNIAEEFGNDDEFIKNTQIPQMSNKSQRTNSYHGAPGSAPRSASVPTVTTYAHKAPGVYQFPGKTSVSMKRSTPASGKLDNTLAQDQKYFDSNLLLTTGENRLTSLNVKLGKQLYPDCVTPFLKALNGHGKVRMQFAGRCISTINKRHTSCQMFRHNLSQSVTGAGQPYPVDMLPYILNPANPIAFYPAGNALGNGNAIGSTSMRDFKNQITYWAPYNLSDLEDLCWNLNKLKLGPDFFAQVANLPNFAYQVPLFQTDDHRRASQIFLNNDKISKVPGTPASATAPYRYNAVFNKGSIHYDFMNKGTGGAKVEIIIYRVKKANQLNSTPSSSFNNDNGFVNKAINTPIGQGYLDTQLAMAGTDALNGKIPAVTDVYEDAAYPLLPLMKKTKQIDCPFVEVVRQTFAMPSGSRRELTFALPGEVYDPNNQMGAAAAPPDTTQPIINNHTYCVYLSVSGVACTDQVMPDSTDPDSVFNVGDMISAANVQFYATYTEHMGACQYKTDKVPNLYSQGGILAPGKNPQTFGADVPITMIDQSSAVRVPTTSTGAGGGGSNLRNDFAAVASP